MFFDDEKAFMKNIGVTVDFDNMTNDDLLIIEEKVSLYLQQHGFDEEYKPTAEGEMCEGILDKL